MGGEAFAQDDGPVVAGFDVAPDFQALHDAALPWLEGPFVPPPGARSPAGRWHSEMGGWSDSVFRGHPVDGCRAAIEAALDKALITTLAGSMMPALNMSTYSPLLAL